MKKRERIEEAKQRANEIKFEYSNYDEEKIEGIDMEETEYNEFSQKLSIILLILIY